MASRHEHHESHEHADSHKGRAHHKEVHLHMARGGRKHRETGGVNDAEMDLRDRPEERTNARKIDREAEEMRRGGQAKRKARRRGGKAHTEHEREKRAHGGHVHHENMDHMKHAKHIGEVHGEHVKHHAARKPRKAGGRTGADTHPFSSARKGTPAPGRREQMEFE